jgi:glycosyltransferase involved in cell wall biosynthesis
VLVPTTPVPSAVPTVVTLHDLMPVKYPQLFETRRRLLFKETLRRACRQASWFIAVSEATKADAVELLRIPEERVVVVHHGVPVHFGRAPVRTQRLVRARLDLSDARIVAFVGEVTARKNVPRLVDAFALVRRDVPDARLVLVGSAGVGAGGLDVAIERLGLGDAVTILGHAEQETTEAIVAAADVLVLPSLDEGFGFPALEAMHVGTAVVASTAGSLPEVVGDAGLLVPATDVDALAAAITAVLLDAGLRAELTARGIQRASRFSWTETARRTLNVYENALRP